MSENDNPEVIPGSETAPEEKEQQHVVKFEMIQGKPIVTWMLIGFTACVYLAQSITKWQTGTDVLLRAGAKISPYITYRHEYWRLITPVFLHGSIMHILFNMYALFTIGPSLENYYGHWDFLRFYLICAFSGNVFSHVFAPQSISVGASTALFGLIGAQAIFFYKNRKIMRNYRMALRNIGFVLVVNLLLGLSGGIDNWGHLGGLAGGLLLSWMCGPELAFAADKENKRLMMVNTVPRSRREISCALVTIFFAVFAFALQAK